MATSNKQAGEWMSPDFNNPAETMDRIANLGYSKPHGPDDTSWIQDDVGNGNCKPSDVRSRGGRNGG